MRQAADHAIKLLEYNISVVIIFHAGLHCGVAYLLTNGTFYICAKAHALKAIYPSMDNLRSKARDLAACVHDGPEKSCKHHEW
jgi:hypothetical protein